MHASFFVHWYNFRGNPPLNFSPAMDPSRRCRNSNRPLLGTGIMYYLIDFLSGITSNYCLGVGVILVLTIIGSH
ncbi:MAG: hypothetical protein Ct9H300mP23_08170 [Nitrospinota bacterium]|nr:MAG: hypothetical protein Ct9H300mP23_08170 [Nitrospinota bacterium]